MDITRVCEKDYWGIIRTHSQETIEEEYGRLVIMSQEEYKEYLKRRNNKKGDIKNDKNDKFAKTKKFEIPGILSR